MSYEDGVGHLADGRRGPRRAGWEEPEESPKGPAGGGSGPREGTADDSRAAEWSEAGRDPLPRARAAEGIPPAGADGHRPQVGMCKCGVTRRASPWAHVR